MLSTPATLSSSNNSDRKWMDWESKETIVLYVNMAAPFISSKANVCVCSTLYFQVDLFPRSNLFQHSAMWLLFVCFHAQIIVQRNMQVWADNACNNRFSSTLR